MNVFLSLDRIPSSAFIFACADWVKLSAWDQTKCRAAWLTPLLCLTANIIYISYAKTGSGPLHLPTVCKEKEVIV